MRVGIGFDVHRLVEGRKLVLGGVVIPFEKGLLGHSDADVLLHSVCDAILGALGEGDIGRHFPDDDSKYKDISSLKLLEEVNRLMKAKQFHINNIDAVIAAEKPKMADYISTMKKNIASALGSDSERINIKATSTEGLGFVGRGEGISAYSVVSLMET
jgi:2-C-methyl-D-erythritol 2,4-cyclodiphosphate synthase